MHSEERLSVAALRAGEKLENIPMAEPCSEPLGLLLPSAKTSCIQVYHYAIHEFTNFYSSDQVYYVYYEQQKERIQH